MQERSDRVQISIRLDRLFCSIMDLRFVREREIEFDEEEQCMREILGYFCNWNGI